MVEITFVRHGQASFGADDYDKLSPLGHQQADWLGQHLAASGQQFDRIICGGHLRHRETLAGIQKSLNHAAVIEDKRLNEMSYHTMELALQAQTGMAVATDQPAAAANFARVMAAWENDEIADIPERYQTFQTRILAALADHARPAEHILIVSSGGPVGVTMRHILGLDLAAMIQVILRTHNASYSRFAVFEGGYHLVQFNGVAHLEPAARRHALTYI